VVDYIHLNPVSNPVRAGAVTAEQAGKYRWGSLRMLIDRKPPAGLTCSEWLEERGGWRDNARGIATCLEYLTDVTQYWLRRA
jgi:hypothetical protein